MVQGCICTPKIFLGVQCTPKICCTLFENLDTNFCFRPVGHATQVTQKNVQDKLFFRAHTD